MSENDNGSCTNWEWGSVTNHRDSEFMEYWWNKYMKNYVPDILTAKRISTDSSSAAGNGQYKIYFIDGTALQIHAIPGSYAWFVFELNANPKSEAQVNVANKRLGKDAFGFYVFPSEKCSITYSYGNNNNDKLLQLCKRDSERDYAGGDTQFAFGEACAELILRNGWKIPKDYPVKF